MALSQRLIDPEMQVSLTQQRIEFINNQKNNLLKIMQDINFPSSLEKDLTQRSSSMTKLQKEMDIFNSCLGKPSLVITLEEKKRLKEFSPRDKEPLSFFYVILMKYNCDFPENLYEHRFSNYNAVEQILWLYDRILARIEDVTALAIMQVKQEELKSSAEKATAQKVLGCHFM